MAPGAGGSIAERARAYQAACRAAATVEKEKDLTRKRQKLSTTLTASWRGEGQAATLPPDVPARTSPARPHAATLDTPTKIERPIRVLTNVMEQRVLKTGLLRFMEVLVSGSAALVAEQLPRLANGAPKLQQSSSVLQRLLRNEVELKSCMENDVSAAQSDLRHLTTEQLLSIRAPTLEFATESQSHSARTSFLETVDKHLFAKLAQKLLRGEVPAPAKPEVSHALGLRLSLIFGASELIEKGWSKQGQVASGNNLPPVPPVWAIKLKQGEWPNQCRVAIFNTSELWVEALPGDAPNIAWACAGSPVAVVCDRTVGVGKDRLLHWEVTVLDPDDDDVLVELDREPRSGAQRHLADELAAALASRKTF